MYCTKERAWQMLIQYGATRPLTFTDIQEICQMNNWYLLAYNEPEACILAEQFHSIQHQMEHFKAFSCLLDDMTAIFYHQDLPVNTRLLYIAHEIGHIKSGHLHTSEPPTTAPWQEVEADAFAYELILPSILVKEANIKTKEQLESLHLLDQQGIWYHLQQIEFYLDISDASLEYSILKNFQQYLEEIRAPQEKKPCCFWMILENQWKELIQRKSLVTIFVLPIVVFFTTTILGAVTWKDEKVI